MKKLSSGLVCRRYLLRTGSLGDPSYGEVEESVGASDCCGG
jgi:hypothetical protein